MEEVSKKTLAQREASRAYYQKHKEEINAKRADYYKERNRKYYEAVRADEEKLEARRKYYRDWNRRKKAEMLNIIETLKMYESQQKRQQTL